MSGLPAHYQHDPVKLPRPACMARSTCSAWPSGWAQILQASTSEVYGDPEVHPQNEDYWGNVNPIGFASCYDEGKRAPKRWFSTITRNTNWT